MTITLDLPVTYIVKGVLPGRKGAREYSFTEKHRVDIEEVAAEDAPVAVSWKVAGVPGAARFDYMHHYEARAADASGRNHTVFHEGRHWLRVLTGHNRIDNGVPERKSSVGLPTAEFVAGAERGGFNFMLGFAPFIFSPKEVHSDPTDGFSSISESSRDRVMRCLDRLGFISVDGILHMSADQPVIALASCDVGPTRFPYPYVTARERTLRENPRVDETLFIPFSMSEELAGFQRALPASVPTSELDPVVHLPESMSRDTDLRAAADFHVKTVLDATKRARTKTYPDLSPYFATDDLDEKADILSDALSAWPGGPGGVSSATLETALAVLDDRSVSVAALAGPGGL